MECTVCLIEWNSSSIVPRMLNCGHSYCEPCLKAMYKPSTQVLTCPSCMVPHRFSSAADLNSLVKNFTLISLVENAKSFTTPTGRPGFGRSKTGITSNREQAFDITDLEECKSEEEMEDFVDLTKTKASKKTAPKISYLQKCEIHDLMIHSYLSTTQELLCTKCIYERNLSTSNIEIVPQVVKDIKQSIDSTRTMILYRRNQLYQALKYLKRMQRGNREVVENKLSEHFAKIRKVVDEFELKTKEGLKGLTDLQNSKYSAIETQVEEYLDKLQNDDLNLSSLESHDDNEIIYMTKIIEDQKHNLINFKPEIDLQGISIALQLRESSYEKMGSLLESTINLMLDSLRLEDDSNMKFEHILEKDRYWLCDSCNKKISMDAIMCDSCLIFKPLEMFKNILHHPEKATDDEIKALNERRRKEKALICDIDSGKGVQKYWFLVSSSWLKQWKCFISNKNSQLDQDGKDQGIINVRMSQNPKVGILPPGPIMNSDLFVKGEDKQMSLLENLELNKDYHGVNKEVWQIFHRMYGGGPVIVRGQLDIYSKDLSEELSQKSRASHSNPNSNHKPSKSNIFAKKDSSPIVPAGRKQQHRNLFQSENIGGDAEEEGIPEEILEIQRIMSMQQKQNNSFFEGSGSGGPVLNMAKFRSSRLQQQNPGQKKSN